MSDDPTRTDDSVKHQDIIDARGIDAEAMPQRFDAFPLGGTDPVNGNAGQPAADPGTDAAFGDLELGGLLAESLGDNPQQDDDLFS